MKRRRIHRLLPLNALMWVWAAGTAGAADDVLIADFEQDDYGAWTVTGEAFGSGPARGTLENQMGVSGYEGKGLVNSYRGGDRSTGTLTSPPFEVQRDAIHFLVGGGKYPGKTCVNLVVDPSLSGEFDATRARVMRTATGPNDQPGGSEKLSWHTWDVRELKGRTAVIQVVDAREGGWGHINVDEIHQSDRMAMDNVRRELEVGKRYLNFPVTHGAPMHKVDVLVDGEKVRELDIELAEGEPEYWVFLDVSAFDGRSLALETEATRRGKGPFEAVYQADAPAEADSFYHEKDRQQFHFSPRRGWNNDPNGMVYYDGEYHLFFQHNPYGWRWGNMTWGHAVSRDMVHWRELDDAIHPDELGTIFSGGAVVDAANTAGFQTGKEQPIVCFYTAAGGQNTWSKGQPYTQCVAYSNDRGRSWTKYEGNPILGHIRGGNRDPKVIWHEPTQRWVMVLYVENHEMDFFTSTNLKDWTFQSRLKSFHECPELFELPVDPPSPGGYGATGGEADNTRWVIYGAHGKYFVGTFDGKTFVPEGEAIEFDRGNCFYASQTFSDMPDDRRVQIAWGRIDTPGMPFNQGMLFPVELALKTTEEGIRMTARPAAELATLYGKRHVSRDLALAGEHVLPDLHGELFHIRAAVRVGEAESMGMSIRGIPVTYDIAQETLACQGKSASMPARDGLLRLELLVDRNSIEIFGNDGEVYMPIGVPLADREQFIGLFSKGGKAVVESLEVVELESAWAR